MSQDYTEIDHHDGSERADLIHEVRDDMSKIISYLSDVLHDLRLLEPGEKWTVPIIISCGFMAELTISVSDLGMCSRAEDASALVKRDRADFMEASRRVHAEEDAAKTSPRMGEARSALSDLFAAVTTANPHASVSVQGDEALGELLDRLAAESGESKLLIGPLPATGPLDLAGLLEAARNGLASDGPGAFLANGRRLTREEADRLVAALTDPAIPVGEPVELEEEDARE